MRPESTDELADVPDIGADLDADDGALDSDLDVMRPHHRRRQRDLDRRDRLRRV
jgi:hypothetical protein